MTRVVSTKAKSLADNEYRCDGCREVFEKMWSDVEAEAEKAGLFPSLKPEDEAVVCDDCFKKIMRRFN